MKNLHKPIFALLIAVLLLGSAASAAGITDGLCLTAAAETYSGPCGINGSNVTWSLDTGTAVLTIGGTGTMTNYRCDYKVDALGRRYDDYSEYNQRPWYDYRALISSVVIEDGVTGIGKGAFSFLPNCSRVTIANSVSTIVEEAFQESAMLSSVTIPDSVTTIGLRAFQNCKLLARVVIGKRVSSIAEGTFQGCTNLVSLTLGSNISSIGASAFENCTSLTRVTIPDSVLSIGNSAFSGCNKLADVTLGSELLSIGSSVFNTCRALPNIHIPSGVLGIGNSAFANCDALQYICSDAGDCYAKTYAEQNNIPFRLCDGHGLTCPHAYTETVTTAPTCTSAGVKTYTCSKCGKSYTESVAALGHAYNADVTKQATCREDGLTTYTCTRCGDSYTETVAKGAHVEKVVRIEPTCTAAGAEYTVCEVCGETLGATTALPMLAHPFGAWVMVTEATAETEGLRERICTVCGFKESEVLPKVVTQTVEDADSGVSLTYNEEAYDGAVELRIAKVFDGAAFDLVELNSEKNAVFDITTMQDGEVVQPKGKVTVRIPVPAGFDPAKCVVYHVSTETGKLEKIPARYADGCMVFETDHFSIYAVAQAKAAPTVTIRNFTANRTVDYRTTITFTADVENETEGTVHWFVDGRDVGTGKTYTVKDAKKTYTVQAKYIQDGEAPIESETETVNVKTGFFARLKAFFRALFGRLPKETQEAFGVERLPVFLP